MPAGVTFELRLEERRSDRVYVSVVLAPGDEAVQIDGVAVQLFHRDGEAVSARLLLPISGVLMHPLVTTVELRGPEPLLPAGCRVVGTAWSAECHLETTCPADMWTELESHVRGKRVVVPLTRAELRPLRPEERASLVTAFPWLGQPVVVPFDGVLEPEPVDEPTEEELDALCAEYGLCGEDADFLKELLTED